MALFSHIEGKHCRPRKTAASNPVSPRWCRSIDTKTSHCRLLVLLRSGKSLAPWATFSFKIQMATKHFAPKNLKCCLFGVDFFETYIYYLAFGFGLGFLLDVFWKETSWFIKCSTSNWEIWEQLKYFFPNTRDPETNSHVAPENGWLGQMNLLLGPGPLWGEQNMPPDNETLLMCMPKKEDHGFSGRLDFWWLKRAECRQKKVFPVVWCFKACYLDISLVFFWFLSVLIFRNHRCSCWCFYCTALPLQICWFQLL